MSCYYPRLLQFEGVQDGKPIYKYVGTPYLDIRFHRERGDIAVPCGKCIGCRLDYASEWSDRMMLELDHSKVAVFVTLTYDDDHVRPCMVGDDGRIYYTLWKKDVQDFNKRLREYFDEKKIRMYVSGEYGPSTSRPHYHGIYFGLSLEDFDLVPLGFNKFHQPLYTSKLLERLWKNGYVSIANVSWQTCNYVSRYTLKKLGGEVLDRSQYNQINEFSLKSLKPGLGAFFYEDHPDLVGMDTVYISDPHGVESHNKIYVPDYVLSKMSLINEESYVNIKERRKISGMRNTLSVLSQTDLPQDTYLDMCANDKSRDVFSLFHDLDYFA